MISGNPGIFEECFWRGVNDVNVLDYGVFGAGGSPFYGHLF